ncbi:germination lipoprotein GerS-related protein [Clostridium hydrogenum]|uniref:germination lipoprotein GerS-related protein n=1 Tax=Clostridium hydrogenum TaxID=2855764 RepID=UPI001F479E75|nr:germination lipoprotein GerS-related protein [Clostridium hydrogenum]
MNKKISFVKISLGICAVLVIVSILFVYHIFNIIKYKDKNVVTYLKNLKSYSCNTDITIKNDKQDVNYKCSQVYALGSGYRMELNKGRTMIFKENKIYVKDKENKATYVTPDSFDEVFKLSFIGEYIGMLYTNENTKYSLIKTNGVEYAIIKITIPNQNRNIKYAEMYVDTKNNVPYKVSIYDDKDKERIQIMYKEFKPNISVDKGAFAIAK